jgi:hypothetical protein
LQNFAQKSCVFHYFSFTLQKIEKTNMARPIKETPELHGKDAIRFEKIISKPKPVSKDEIEKARKAYEFMKSISDFQW